jgi:hypothetical protein
MAKGGKKPRSVKNLHTRSLTPKQARRVKGGADLLPAVRRAGQVSMADGSVRNAAGFKLQKV